MGNFKKESTRCSSDYKKHIYKKKKQRNGKKTKSKPLKTSPDKIYSKTFKSDPRHQKFLKFN